MAGAEVKAVPIKDLVSKMLQPALTSHYVCNFQPPESNGFLNARFKSLGIRNDGISRNDFLSIPCAEASLPGSTLATHEINNDYTGVTERHAYRRQYDDRADFTFYVDSKTYYVIKFFESWIGFAVDEQYGQNGKTIQQRDYNYRTNYPDAYYAKSLSITKFERDYDLSTIKKGGRRSSLEYNFINAFPININSMPVSYDSSQLLKCTVSFTYTRYWIKSEFPVPGIEQPASPNVVNASTGTLTNVAPTSRIITNEYYNNFGDPSQDNTNFGRGIG